MATNDPSRFNRPRKSAYDVVIVGGAAMGSSAAWFLATNPTFDGSVLVVERDPTYRFSSTALSCSGIRHQFSNAVNVKISLFGTDFISNFKKHIEEPNAPGLNITEHGYLFLCTPLGEQVLTENHEIQNRCGAATRLLTPQQIIEQFPYFNVEDISMGSWNPRGEGWFDSYGMMQTLRRKAISHGVEYIHNEVMELQKSGDQIHGAVLSSGDSIQCQTLVNCSGPRAALIAAYADIKIPVFPRKRNVFVLSCESPIAEKMPLTIDPTGVYVRPEGALFLAGISPEEDPTVEYDDFEVVHSEFEEVIWPILAHRIPQFEAVKVVNSWAGHYAYNSLDQNAMVGRHPEVTNFIFANGFSGHGVQQAPAVGRGVSELIIYNEYRSLDMSDLGFQRIIENKPFLEKSII